MGTELSLPKGFGAVSAVFGGGKAGANDELGAGVNSSYGIVGYKGKVWSIRFGGEDKPLMREDGDGPRNSIEVVLVKASAAISKIFYKNGYVEGSNAAPDCWSADGVKPDASVQNKCNATCADCPMNAWGSRVTDAGKQGKQCADSRRVAVIPAEDMDNELFGGPMLLRVPAASLKDLKAYGDLLSSYQYPYYAAVTRIAFDPKEAYPKFVFSAVRPLNDAEAAKVMLLRDDKRVGTVLAETAMSVGAGAAGEAKKQVASSPFEQDAPEDTAATSAPVQEKTAAASQASTAAPTVDAEAEAKKAAAKEKKRLAAEAAAKAAAEAYRLAALADADDDEGDDEVDPETGEVTPAGNTPASFDAMLDAIL